MKKNIFTLLLLFAICFTQLKAESIIYKKTATGLAALTEDEVITYGLQMYDALEAYTWPTCQMSELTKEEQRQIFGPDESEEKFLEAKLNSIVPSEGRDFEFKVAFIPTTVYEIFLIERARKEALYKEMADKSYLLSVDSKNVSKKEFYKRCRNYNDKNIAFTLQSHADIVARILELYPHMHESEAIIFDQDPTQPNRISIILDQLLHEIKKVLPYKKATELIKEITFYQMIAHNINKEIIIRGAKEFPHHSQTSLIALPKRGNCPYSMSLGTTLFSGYFHHPASCAYYFINGITEFGQQSETGITKGFILYIDKQEYYNNQCDHLFFIPPLTTTASICGNGEIFHSRTMTTTKDSAHCTANGLYLGTMTDHDQMLFVKRDPIVHAHKFLQYFLKNSTLLIDNQQYSVRKCVEVERKILWGQCLAYTQALDELQTQHPDVVTYEDTQRHQMFRYREYAEKVKLQKVIADKMSKITQYMEYMKAHTVKMRARL